MAENSVTQLLSLINQQVELLEIQGEYLSKAMALTKVALGGHFLDQPKLTVHEYLSTLSDLLEKVLESNEASLAILMETVSKIERNQI